MICSNQQQSIVIVVVVLIQALSNDAWSEDNSFSTRCGSSHLVDQIKIMLARNISNINWSARDTASCSMKARIIVNSLKHVPIGDQI